MWCPPECRFPRGLVPLKKDEVPDCSQKERLAYPGNSKEGMNLLTVTVEELVNNVHGVQWIANGDSESFTKRGPYLPDGAYEGPTDPETLAKKMKWYGNITLNDILNYSLYKPAVENIPTLQEIARRKIPDALSPRRVGHISIDGGELLIERYANRHDKIFRELRRGIKAGSGMFLNLYVCVEGHCGRDAKEIMWTGLPAVAFADIAEAVGYRCRIFFINISTNAYRSSQWPHLGLFVPLKDYNEVLDPERMLFYLGCPGFFRAVCLAGYRLSALEVSGGFGQPPRGIDMVEKGLKEALPALGWADEARTYVFGETFNEKEATALLELRITQLLGQRDLFTEAGERVDG